MAYGPFNVGSGSGPETIKNATGPTKETVGKLGQHFLNTTTGKEYVCVSTDGGYTWSMTNASGAEDIIYNEHTVKDVLDTVLGDTGLGGMAADILELQMGKADLVDGKVPESQLPEMDYDLAGAAAEVQADLDMHAQNGNNPHGVTAEQAGAVPTTRTVNGKALTSDISLSAADVDAYSKSEMDTAIDNLANQRNYSYGTEDMTAGESVLETGKLYFVYE